MVDRFSSYFDSTRKILNTKLGEFSFFLPSWMKIFMHTWSCTLFDALTIFRSMSLSTMFVLPFLSFVFPRFIRSLTPPQSYRTNSKIYAADFLLPLSYRYQITHVTRDVVLYMCVFLCFSFTCVRFVPSTLCNYQICVPPSIQGPTRNIRALFFANHSLILIRLTNVAKIR